jgi:hypothetical protein
LVDWEVSEQLVVVSGGLQFLLELSIQLEAIDKLYFLSLLQKLEGHAEHIGLHLFVDMGQRSLNGQPKVDFL